MVAVFCGLCVVSCRVAIQVPTVTILVCFTQQNQDLESRNILGDCQFRIGDEHSVRLGQSKMLPVLLLPMAVQFLDI